MNTISWKNETTPLPMEINPRIAFERLFGQPGTAAQRLARMRDNKSILDSVREEARDLQKTLGGKDQARLNDYLDNVRDLERRRDDAVHAGAAREAREADDLVLHPVLDPDPAEIALPEAR